MSIEISDDERDVWVVYDQECPFCSRFVLLYKMRQNGRRVHMIDARSDHPLVAEVRSRNFDLNEGMIVRWRGVYHYGPQAMHLLALLGGNRSIFNAINQLLFRYPPVARVVYPCLVAGRKATLRILGRQLIES